MGMSYADGAACPVSAQKIGSAAARVNGVLVTALLVISLFTPARWVLVLLAADFAVKVFVKFRYSPLSAVSRRVVAALKLQSHPVDAAPKRFAAVMGLAFCVAGVLLGIVFDFPVAYDLVVGVCCVCAALEGFAGICVGCHVYQLVVRPGRRA